MNSIKKKKSVNSHYNIIDWQLYTYFFSISITNNNNAFLTTKIFNYKYLPIVHCKDIFSNPSKLHDDIINIRFMDYLKILYAGLKKIFFMYIISFVKSKDI